MHRHVDWMVPADVSILEFLHSARTARGDPAILTPKTMHLNTGYSREHCSARSGVLVNHGLVEKLGHGEYRLTDRGEQLLEGDLDPEDL